MGLAPGSEMYRNLGAEPGAACDFYLKYQDRILYRTDYGAGAALAEQRIEIDAVEAHSLFRLVQGFLELEGEFGPLFDGAGEPFYGIDFALRGIALPPEVLEKICIRNFYRVFPSRPRAPAPEAIAEECTRPIGVISWHGRTRPNPSGEAVEQA